MRHDAVTIICGTACVAIAVVGVMPFLRSTTDGDRMNSSIPSPVTGEIGDRMSPPDPRDSATVHTASLPSMTAEAPAVAAPDSAHSAARPGGKPRHSVRRIRHEACVTPVRHEPRDSSVTASRREETHSTERADVTAGVPPVGQAPDSTTIYEARIAREQTVADGGFVELLAAEAIHAGGTVIPRGTRMKAMVEIRDSRIRMTVGTVRIGRRIHGVSLAVCDMDGMEGFALPRSVVAEGKEGAAEAASDLLAEAGNAVRRSVPTVVASAAGGMVRGVQGAVRRSGSRRSVRFAAGERIYLTRDGR